MHGQHAWMAWASVLLALGLAAFELTLRRLANRVNRLFDRFAGPVLDRLVALHSGLVGNYVAWGVVGLALWAIGFGLT